MEELATLPKGDERKAVIASEIRRRTLSAQRVDRRSVAAWPREPGESLCPAEMQPKAQENTDRLPA